MNRLVIGMGDFFPTPDVCFQAERVSPAVRHLPSSKLIHCSPVEVWVGGWPMLLVNFQEKLGRQVPIPPFSLPLGINPPSSRDMLFSATPVAGPTHVACAPHLSSALWGPVVRTLTGTEHWRTSCLLPLYRQQIELALFKWSIMSWIVLHIY